MGVSAGPVESVGLAGKRTRLGQAHVPPLNSFVRSWRSVDLARLVLWFDPDDGGPVPGCWC